MTDAPILSSTYSITYSRFLVSGLCKTVIFILFATIPPAGTRICRHARDNRLEHFTDSDIMADLTGGCRQINKVWHFTSSRGHFVGLLYNLHVHSRLLCCQLSCWLYLHALSLYLRNMRCSSNMSICAPVVVATGCLVLPAMVCMSTC